jgi:transcription antitermination factor NusG
MAATTQHLAASSLHPVIAGTPIAADPGSWYALSTLPKNEKSVARSLESRGYEVFLPTYEVTRIWKNRQRMTLQLPLFIGYVFTRLKLNERFRALGIVGTLRFVGNSQGPLPIPAPEIDFLRSRYCSEHFKPFPDLVVGQRVRITRGPMRGVEGMLVRKDSDLRFVLTLELINQHIAAVVDPADLQHI